LIRNGAAHLAVPIPYLNELFTNIITNHLGPKVSNPESTFPGATFQVQYLINEDEAGNLLHFILLTVIIVLTVWYQRLKDEHSWKYISGIIISIVLFSLMIKWQPWGVRLQLPIFMLGGPLVGYGIEKLKLSKIATLICVIGLITYSLPYLTLNSTRPLVPILPKGSPLRSNRVRRFFSNKPTLYNEYAEIIAPYYKDQSVLYADRESQYFFSNYSIYQDYQAVMDVVNGFSVDTIGLLFDNNDWEYPIWVMADSHAYVGTPTFKHIIFRNTSGEGICNGAYLPRYVISTQMLKDGLICGIKYNEIVTTSSLSLLER
jgi:hypothetical protein